MKPRSIGKFLLLLLFAAPGVASAAEIVEAKIARGITDRTPTGVAERFPASVDTLYCFTRLTGAERETAISHVWRYADREMARVELPVRSADWRTWSSKRILPSWSGPWQVDVVDAQGRLLEKLIFSVGGE